MTQIPLHLTSFPSIISDRNVLLSLQISTGTYRMLETNPKFRKFIIETAIENVEKQVHRPRHVCVATLVTRDVKPTRQHSQPHDGKRHRNDLSASPSLGFGSNVTDLANPPRLVLG